jgi:hypothetical protein
MGGVDACRDGPMMTREKSISVDCCIYCIGDVDSWLSLERKAMPLDKYEDLGGRKARSLLDNVLLQYVA